MAELIGFVLAILIYLWLSGVFSGENQNNKKFGEYHTLDMLSDTEQLMKKCRDKRDEALVKDFISLWRKCTDGI